VAERQAASVAERQAASVAQRRDGPSLDRLRVLVTEVTAEAVRSAVA
jgi:hypothetical protein